MSEKKALVCGAGGFIGSHLVKRLRKRKASGSAASISSSRNSRETEADDFIDRRSARPHGLPRRASIGAFDEVYQLAADMGGAGFIFTGENDADIMHNSALINLNMRRRPATSGTSSASSTRPRPACTPSTTRTIRTTRTASRTAPIPPTRTANTAGRSCSASGSTSPITATTAWRCAIARFHNIFGPEGTWNGGREKAPAALCRKVAEAPDGGEIEIWGDGTQTRSFLYVDECVEGTLRLMRSDFDRTGQHRLRGDGHASTALAEMIMEIAGKKLSIRHIAGPQGVRGRNSDNRPDPGEARLGADRSRCGTV